MYKILFVTIIALSACSIFPGDYSEELKILLDEKELAFTVEASGDFRIVFQIDAERLHEVYISPSIEEDGKLKRLRIYSFAGVFENVPQAVIKRLMLENASKKIGRWSLLPNDNYKAVVLAHTIQPGIQASALFDILSIMAREADAFEAAYNTDLF